MQRMLESVEYLYLRDKHALPRGAFRKFPLKDRRGSQYAEPLSTMKEIKDYLRWGKDVFMSVFSLDQRKSGMFDMIFLDIDDKDLKRSYAKLHRVLDLLDSNGVYGRYVVFSGSKGFHIYIPFEETLLISYGIAVRRWLEKVGILGLVDLHVIEPNRVSRIPYSRNLNGTNCIPLSDNGAFAGIRQIEQMAKDNEDPDFKWRARINSNLSKTLRRFDMDKPKGGRMEHEGISKVFTKLEYYPPCIRRLVIAAEKGIDLGHDERIELGKFMLHVHAGDIEKVSKFYSKMSDFNEVITNYQLQYLKDTGQKMSGCDRMQLLGMCEFEKHRAEDECAFYPTINKIIRICSSGQ